MPPLDLSSVTECQKKDILKYAIENRRFEIERFWQRSVFFWGLIAAALIAYAALYAKAEARSAALLISCFGLVCSIGWALQNRGSKYWQEAWEQKVMQVEKDVLGVPLFANTEDVMAKGLWGARKYSVSRLAIAVADFTSVLWLVLFLDAVYQSWAGLFSMSGVAVAVTGCAIALLALKARSAA